MEALEGGELVIVSPEAKRNYTDDLILPFKYGAAVMSVRTGAPIVPYAIAGDYRLFGRRLTIAFGWPLFPREGEGPEELNRRLYNSIGAILRRIMPREELESKHWTTFEEWSEQNGANGKTS